MKREKNWYPESPEKGRKDMVNSLSMTRELDTGAYTACRGGEERWGTTS